MHIDELIQLDSYAIAEEQKQEILLEQLNKLTMHHRQKCPAYDRLLDAHGVRNNPVTDISEFFPLPVRLFKEYDLRAVRLRRLLRP